MLTLKELNKTRYAKKLKRNSILKARKHLYGSVASAMPNGSSQDKRNGCNKLTLNLWRMKPSKRSRLLKSLSK